MPVLPDLLAPGLTTVFCGSAASTRAAMLGAYYAGPGNRFWDILFETGFTPRRFAAAEWPRLAALGIGLTDLCKEHFGADAELPPGGDDAAAVRAKIACCRPHLLAFTSKRPARVVLGRAVAYGEQAERLGATRVFVLPSPSGRARRFWSPAPWQALAAEHRSLRQMTNAAS